MERIGRIVAVGQGEVTVDLGRTVRVDGCSDGGCSGCAAPEDLIVVRWDGPARVGQRIGLRCLDGLHRSMGWLAFIAAFTAVLGLAVRVAPATRGEGREQALAILAGLAAGAAGLLLVRRGARRLPRYRARAGAGGEGR